MLDGARREKWERQTKDSFEALGRFVQAFELMIAAIRHTATGFVQTRENSDMVILIFNHGAMSAKTLWDLCHAFLRIKVKALAPGPDADVASAMVAQMHKEVGDLAEMRNGLLHGTWHIGWTNSEEEDFSKLGVHKFEVKKDGLRARDLPKTAEELLALVQRCDRVGDNIRIFSSLMIFGGSIARNFVIDADGWWDRPEELKPPKL